MIHKERITKPFAYTNKYYWISVLRRVNRIIRFNLYWDFKRKDWRLIT